MSFLRLENLTLRYGPKVALGGLNLEVSQGEFFSVLGPSGCGKTTTIRLIAGFLRPDSGRIFLHGKDITALPPERRNMGMVFQSYALFPHLNVLENVAFGLRARRVSFPKIRDRVKEALQLVNLSGYDSRPVYQLSGGEQQRVAIARAVVIEPEILLLDEPLSNLDASLRESTRRQLRQLTRSLGITTVFVTHDQEEAFSLSDRIALLFDGVCQQIATPQELYLRPANEVVAAFIGKSNILSLPCKSVQSGSALFTLPSGFDLVITVRPEEGIQPGQVYRILLRPEAIRLEPEGAGPMLGSGKILGLQFAGSYSEYFIDINGQDLTVVEPGVSGRHAVGEEVRLYCVPKSAHLLK